MITAPARHDGFRWGLSFGVAVAGHAAVAAMLLWPQAVVEPAAPLAPAVMLDLAPLLPAAAAQPQPSPPPAAEPVTEPVSEPEPVPTPEPEPVPKPQPQPKPKPKPAPEAKPRNQPVERTPTAAAPSPAATSAPPQPAPAVASRPAAPSHLMPTWHSVLAAHLERHKRYPRTAVFRRQQGVAHLRFTIDRAGNVLAHAISRSSGIAALDEETLQMVGRAQPFPQPPADLPGERFEFEVPVHFALR